MASLQNTERKILWGGPPVRSRRLVGSSGLDDADFGAGPGGTRADRGVLPTLRFDEGAALQLSLGDVEVIEADMIERPEVSERQSGAPHQGQFTFPRVRNAEDWHQVTEGSQG